MRGKLMLAALPVALALGGCGGGSAGGPASTPPPPTGTPAPSPAPSPAPTPAPTPPPTNTTVYDLQANQTFANNAARLQASWDLVTKTGLAQNARRSSLTVSYDAATKGYTVVDDLRSRTFASPDLQHDDSVEVAYKNGSGGGFNYLTLLKGGSGPGRYVRQAFWQYIEVAGSTQKIDFTSFTYGFPTDAASVPRTGTGDFVTDVFGAVSAPGGEPRSFAGSGTFNVDFAAGVFSTRADLREHELVSGGEFFGGGINFTATGNISSSDGTFAGNALYSGWFGRSAGSLAGSFYGPGAAELGATFFGNNSDGAAVAGSFTGVRGGTSANLTLTNLRQRQQFYVDSGHNRIGNLVWENASTYSFGSPTSQFYSGQFAAKDEIAGEPQFQTFRKLFTGVNGDQLATLQLYRPGQQNGELALTYASFGHWSATFNAGFGVRPQDVYFAYGFTTPAGILQARTGTASYSGVVYGTGSNMPQNLYYDVTGSSLFNVDFSAQRYSGSLTMRGVLRADGSQRDFGAFDFAGPLSGYLEETNVSLFEAGRGAGQMTTRFYGPDGEEIGGPFDVHILDGPGGPRVDIEGVTVARRP